MEEFKEIKNDAETIWDATISELKKERKRLRNKMILMPIIVLVSFILSIPLGIFALGAAIPTTIWLISKYIKNRTRLRVTAGFYRDLSTLCSNLTLGRGVEESFSEFCDIYKGINF